MSDTGQTRVSDPTKNPTSWGAAVEADENIVAIARAAIAQFGHRAVTEMNERANAHLRAGETETADMWRRVAVAASNLHGKRD
jgi:hypothetical protein